MPALVHQSFHSFKDASRASTSFRISDLLLGSSDSITYPWLVALRRRGFRNGNWKNLDAGQRALFRCALWVAKARGRISNLKFVAQILDAAVRLLESSILKVGRQRATKTFETFSKPGGVFGWAPTVRHWLSESSYVQYLGVLEVNS
jgi:hypothetical protein